MNEKDPNMKERLTLHLITSTFVLYTTVILACHPIQNDPIKEKAAPIRINQLGYYTNGPKIAIISESSASEVKLFDAETEEVVWEGNLGTPELWPYSNELVRVADFSDFKEAGTYFILVPGEGKSIIFPIGEYIHADVHKASLKAFYFQRSSTSIDSVAGGQWHRPLGHPDNHIIVHSSAESEGRQEGTIFSSPYGWYDAGDYGKYVPNAGFCTYSLLSLYEQFPEYYDMLELSIPESGNDLPDILDEALWSLRWLGTMVDPQSGAVHHKLTTLNFIGQDMPHETQEDRYAIGKSTGAALNVAAVMAQAARIYKKWNPTFADSCLWTARKAWDWARTHPAITFHNPTNISTGEYSDTNYKDEFQWAAIEFFITTKEDSFLHHIDISNSYYDRPPEWVRTGLSGWISLLNHKTEIAGYIDTSLLVKKFLECAERFEKHASNISAYKVPIGENEYDFVWGSNGVTANQGRILIYAYHLSKNPAFLTTAIATMDYLLGRNPLAYCFVTGFGHNSPMDIHHRLSAADEVTDPVPGLLVGGPFNRNNPDNCGYNSKYHATTYIDSWCSYSTNEIAINWNASFAYLSGSLEIAMQQFAGKFDE